MSQQPGDKYILMVEAVPLRELIRLIAVIGEGHALQVYRLEESLTPIKDISQYLPIIVPGK
jgi:hypothetical protein